MHFNPRTYANDIHSCCMKRKTEELIISILQYLPTLRCKVARPSSDEIEL